MRHLIKHTTRYHYTAPVSYSIQLLRLTPRQDEHQRLLRWHIDAPGLLEEQVDAYGNITHTLTLTQPHDAIELKVTGQIEVSPLDGGAVHGVSTTRAVPGSCSASRRAIQSCALCSLACSCTGETLTLSSKAGASVVRHCATCCAACWNTQSPSGTIRPDSSASAMNSPGLTTPRSGWFQRMSASALTMRPLAISTMGW